MSVDFEPFVEIFQARAYSTDIEKLIRLSNAWQDEQQVADVFISRMSHPFGKGSWGDEGEGKELSPELRREVFKQALSGSKIALHSRSSNLFATLDNDDFFQCLGGTAMAIRSVDGKTPEVMVTDLSNPRRPAQTTLEKYMGQELQTRYLSLRCRRRTGFGIRDAIVFEHDARRENDWRLGFAGLGYCAVWCRLLEACCKSE